MQVHLEARQPTSHCSPENAGHCGGGCRLTREPPADAPAGWPLVRMTLVAFAGPLLLLLAGMIAMMGLGIGYGMLGGLAGLATGILIARRANRRWSSTASDSGKLKRP